MEGLIEKLAGAPEWLKVFILAISTFGSEDLTTITAGILVSQDSLHWLTAMLGCFIGIFVGDGILYFIGLTLGKPALKIPFFRKLLPPDRVDACRQWFEQKGIWVVLISRFIPGTRLPTYFAAGLLGSGARWFLPAAALATAIWTPLLVGAAWYYGDKITEYMVFNEKYQWLFMIGGIVSLFILMRTLLMFTQFKRRRRFQSRMRRVLRWEFWPILVIYPPVFLYNLWLALRYRSLTLPFICNPGIDFSGFVGESKTEIFAGFEGNEQFFARSLSLAENANAQQRLAEIKSWMVSHTVAYPIFLKPDVGERGFGVRKCANEEAVLRYLQSFHRALQIQEYAPGPYEFGVYYVRLPNEEHGKVLGLTGKEFPRIVGDGKRTIEELILGLPQGLGRYHIYRERFKDRLGEVLPDGSVLELVQAGNHCLGTIFNDSSHLLTDALCAKFDAISRSLKGFYIGRYDVRAANLEDFRNARAFKIVELNGATGEPAHMYDIRHSLWFAYRCLFRHYATIWKIGSQNAAAGTRKMSVGEVLTALRERRKHRDD